MAIFGCRDSFSCLDLLDCLDTHHIDVVEALIHRGSRVLGVRSSIRPVDGNFEAASSKPVQAYAAIVGSVDPGPERQDILEASPGHRQLLELAAVQAFPLIGSHRVYL